ncbi:MAG: 4-vinyl reductase [Candidatus Lokiarchaeota archaeon]|nr:4-vinyl reductase [Candidatus Harpocratesius repetitus]
MFKYNKEKHYVKLFCPQCNSNIEFLIPDSVFSKPHEHYPFTFRYIHGNPAHSVTLYFDKELNIRGKEFGDSLQLSNEIIENMFRDRKITQNDDSSKIIKTLFNTFTTIIDARVPKAEEIHYIVGKQLGDKFEGLFFSEEEEALLEEISRFWKRNGFGIIDELRFEPSRIIFNVYECFECSHLPNLGRPVCKLDEGFFTTLFEKKFGKEYEIKELECFATGNDHCQFQIKEVGRKVI